MVDLNNPFFGDANPVYKRLAKHNIPVEVWEEYLECIKFYGLPYRYAHKIIKSEGVEVSRSVLNKMVSMDGLWREGRKFKQLGYDRIKEEILMAGNDMRMSAWQLVNEISAKKQHTTLDRDSI